MTTTTNRRRRVFATTAITAAVIVAGCGDSDETTTTDTPTTGAAATDTSEAASADGFPLTVANCDTELTFDAPPQRVVLMEASAPSLLFAAGAIDRVVAHIEDFPPEYYTTEQIAILDKLPTIDAEATSTGGVEVSIEAIIALEPDLVIGYDTETITQDGLAAVGIPLYVMPPFCDTPPTPSFDSIVDEVRNYGTIFGTPDIANPAADALAADVQTVIGNEVAAGKTAAALYVSSDGSAIYAYSPLGMVHPQIEALGMTNVFADLSERVAEVSIEEVIDRNPDVLILLYDDTGLTAEDIAALVTDLPGASTMAAVGNGDVYPVLFNYSEPPTPLVVDGLKLIAEMLSA
jgi:iron complex transport system substrate-binding protein